MKKIKFARGVLLTFLIIIACTKDFEDIILDKPDFEFTGNHIEEGFIFEKSEVSFSVEPERIINTIKYQFNYEVLQGEGYYQDEKGNKILEKQDIDLEDLVWKYEYIPTGIGKHEIKFISKDSNGNEKFLEIAYDIDYAPFSLLVNKGAEEFIINSENLTVLTLLRDKETTSIEDENQTFSINYTVENGTGEFYHEDVVLKSGEEYPFEKGLTNLSYLPTSLGKHTIKIHAEAPDYATAEVEIEVNVIDLSFTIIGNSESNKVNLNTDLGLFIELATADDKSTVTYEIAHSFSTESVGAATIKDENDVTLVAGEFNPITSGEFKYNFNSSDLGDKILYFDIRDSNGQIKRDSVLIEVSNVPFVFTGNAENNAVFINQNSELNFNLDGDKDIENIDYFLSYEIETGNGTLVDKDGAEMINNTPYEIEIGSFALDYKPSSLGEHDLIFKVTDSYGQESGELSINIGSEDVKLTFQSNIAKTEMIVKLDNAVTVSLQEDKKYESVAYELSYFITGGTAALYDADNVVVESSTYLDILPGEQRFVFIPETPGTYDLNFRLRDSNDQIIEDNQTIIVTPTDFSISSGFSAPFITLGDSNTINLNLSPTATENGATYSFTFESNLNGSLSYNETVYTSGQIIPIEIGQSIAVFSPLVTGNYILDFRVTDSNGVSKNTTSEMEVQNGGYTFSASANPTTFFVSEGSTISLDLAQNISNASASYEVMYTTESNVSMLQGGNAIIPGVFVPLAIGSTLWTFQTSDTGAVALTIMVRDNASVTEEEIIAFTVKEKDYTLSAIPSKNNEFINVPVPINLELIELANDSNDTYEIYFSSTKQGHLLFNSNVYSFGERFSVEKGINQFSYVGEENGSHGITFSVTSSSGVLKSTTTAIEYERVLYDFAASSINSSMVIDDTAKVNLSINETSGTSTYKVKYTLLSGSAILTDQNENQVNQGDFIEVPTGTTNWTMNSTTIGTVNMLFTTVNATGEEVDSPVSIVVNPKDYNFTAIAGSNSAYIGETVSFISTISELDLGGETYTAYYTTSGTGAITIGGSSYAPGSTFSLPIGSSDFVYTGLDQGNHEIQITVTSSGNIEKKQSIRLVYSNVLYDFSSSAVTNSITLGDATGISLNINETSGSSTYKTKYTLLSGSAILSDQNGKQVNQGAFVEVPTGTTNWTMNSTTIGTVNIIFTTINATGEEVDSPVSIVVNPKDYNFTAIAESNSAYIGETVSFISTISELDLGGETYTAYYTTSGTGAITIGGSSYAPGSTFSLPIGSSDFVYTGLDQGNHEIQITVTSSGNIEKKQSIRLVYSNVLYDFSSSAVTNSITLGDATGISLNINETSGSSTYKTKYTLLSGSAILSDQNGKQVNQGAFVEVPTGTTNWTMQSAIEGTVNIIFTTINTTGEEVDSSVSINVAAKNYSFAATPSSTEKFIGDSVTIATTLTEIGSGGETYTAYYSNSAIGVLNYNGSNYNPGEFFPITIGNNSFTYSGTQEGIHSLDFTITSSKGLVKTASVNIGFNYVTHKFTIGSRYVDLTVGEIASTNFNIEEVLGNSTYKMSYTVLSGSPTIKDHNGNPVSPGTEVSVPVGGFTWDITSSVAGSNTVRFDVENATGYAKDDSATYVYAPYQEPFTLRITQSSGIKLAEEAFDMNVVITADDTHNSNIIYTMSYEHQSENTGYVMYNGVRYNEGDRFTVNYNTSTLQFVTTSTTNLGFQVEFKVENGTAEDEEETEFIAMYKRPIVSNIRTARSKYNERSCNNGCQWDNRYSIDFDTALDPTATGGELTLNVRNENTNGQTYGYKSYPINPDTAERRDDYYVFLTTLFDPTYQALEFDGQPYNVTFTDSNGVVSIVYSGTFTDSYTDGQ